MAGASRDRVTIDLCGIGDAVRAAATRRGLGVAQLVRRAIVASLDLRATAEVATGSDGQTPVQSMAKLTLRLPQPQADALILNAGSLGLSYGEYVARLVGGSPLPRPAAERAADRAALMAASDHLAVLSADLNAFMRLLRRGSSAEVETYRRRIETVDTDIRHHLDLASKFMADPSARRSR